MKLDATFAVTLIAQFCCREWQFCRIGLSSPWNIKWHILKLHILVGAVWYHRLEPKVVNCPQKCPETWTYLLSWKRTEWQACIGDWQY